MTTFKINNNLSVECTFNSTRSGFSHTAQAIIDGEPAEKVRCNYLNRTWERFEFESALLKLADNTDMTVGERKAIKEYVEKRK